ncbi:MAG TPA: hypothetical protein DE312_02135 [Gallionella sp.]|nr:MAG: hypothetical protein A2Z87_03810 [Gallionellales bacterium GWA2_54_124]OGT18000.1 MAG: hypothetical protein A2522_08140 [Gallionellales bacterium RIFOXYD12_FULL_53_10]HCI52125.1 hypothetical protein [Gallionella sp.]
MANKRALFYPAARKILELKRNSSPLSTGELAMGRTATHRPLFAGLNYPRSLSASRDFILIKHPFMQLSSAVFKNMIFSYRKT